MRSLLRDVDLIARAIIITFREREQQREREIYIYIIFYDQ